jgi:hypothetical protein
MPLQVGLEAWVIQDGNYGEFEAGCDYRFALEIYAAELAPLTEAPAELSLRYIARDHHEAEGEVIYCSDEAWVVDFGVPAYDEGPPPPWASVGIFVRGHVSLGVAPFLYRERLKEEADMPDLLRNWQLRGIQLETTPWLEKKDPVGGTLIYRDATRESFRPVEKTDAWNDDNGHGDYLLECELKNAAG